MNRRRASALLGVVVIAGAAGALLWPGKIVVVAPGTSLQAAIDAAPAGTTLRLQPGTYPGPVTIDRRLAVMGRPGAVVEAGPQADAAISVMASGVTLRDFEVRGGLTGVYVREAEGVVLEDLKVAGAEMEGIDIADARATVDGVLVEDLVSPLSQGIEIRNSEHRGTNVVRDSSVTGGQEGIVSHVSRVRFEDNTVRGTTMHAVSITEMSQGVAVGNTVAEASGAGLYCGDMSRCDFRANDVDHVGRSGEARFQAGWGLLVHYHSSAHSDGDRLAGAAGGLGVFDRSHMRPASALKLGAGWRGILPIVPVSLTAIAILFLVAVLARRAIPRADGSRAFPWLITALLVGLLVQTFHMAEHWVQVYRVYSDGVPSRGSLVGSLVDTEWVHLVYNAAVLGFLGLVLSARLRGWMAASPSRWADAILTSAVVIQGYHLVEHSLKVYQHVTTGAKVNPGIVGRHIDLVWFHFGINLAVYVGFAAACFAYLRLARASEPSPREARLSAPAT